MWLMSEVKKGFRPLELEGLARRLLVINCATIHTTSTVSPFATVHTDGEIFPKF